MEDIFRLPGSHAQLEYFGWVGWDPRKFDSVRTPGAINFLDPSQRRLLPRCHRRPVHDREPVARRVE